METRLRRNVGPDADWGAQRSLKPWIGCPMGKMLKVVHLDIVDGNDSDYESRRHGSELICRSSASLGALTPTGHDNALLRCVFSCRPW